jgi:hypothetical protein
MTRTAVAQSVEKLGYERDGQGIGVWFPEGQEVSFIHKVQDWLGPMDFWGEAAEA